MKIGDKEFEVPDEVAAHYKDMDKKMKDYADMDKKLEDAMKQIGDLDEFPPKEKDEAGREAKAGAMDEDDDELDELSEENDKLTARIDELESKLESVTKADESKEFRAKVREYAAAKAVGGRYLKNDEAAKLDDMDLLDIKKAVIKADSPDVAQDKLDKESYVTARFDMIAERSDKSKGRYDSLGNAITQSRKDRSENHTDEDDDEDYKYDENAKVSTPREAKMTSIRRDMAEMQKRMKELAESA